VSAVVIAVVVVFVLVTLGAGLATLLKRKWASLVVGLISAPVWWVAGSRLARPNSWWARRFYDEAKIERARSRSGSRRYRAAVVGGLVLAVGFNALIFGTLKAYRIAASSMEPTLRCARPGTQCTARTADRVIVLKYVAGIRPHRGALVAYHATAEQASRCNAKGIFIHRIVGLPGEHLTETGGQVLVDGEPLEEPYLHGRSTRGLPLHVTVVPSGHYFLMGDKRAYACDSRAGAAVARDDIIGRVIFRYWPPGRVGTP